MSGIGTLIFVGAVMTCILGGITVVAHIYNLNSIKSKTVGDGQHGTARWATKPEIRKTYKHIPFTPEKWRKQAENGQTPKSVSSRKNDSERKRMNRLKKRSRKVLLWAATAASSAQLHLLIREMFMCL